jgi:hypothetical protein
MKKSIQIGTSDFKELIEENNYFIDKSLLIKEFLESGAKIILTPRPRRFGKTLNLSMLRYFFDIRTKEETKELFKGLKIESKKEIMKIQGEYPVVFITFKNRKHINYKEFVEGMIVLIFNLYREYEFLLESDKLTDLDKRKYKKVLNENINLAELQNSINDLVYYLNKHYRKRVMLFIDEYDVPIQEAYIRGYYDDMIILIRNLLTSVLKDNRYLEKAMITGILRVAKESIFSGLNNLQVNTILGLKFTDKFGFMEDELKEVLTYYNVQDKSDDIKNGIMAMFLVGKQYIIHGQF